MNNNYYTLILKLLPIMYSLGFKDYYSDAITKGNSNAKWERHPMILGYDNIWNVVRFNEYRKEIQICFPNIIKFYTVRENASIEGELDRFKDIMLDVVKSYKDYNIQMKKEQVMGLFNDKL